MKKIFSTFLPVLLFIMGFANPRLPKIFGDNMVLQRERAIPIWGWADPGEKISVQFNHQTKMVKADKTGKWMVKLDPESAGGPLCTDRNRKNKRQLRKYFGGRSMGLFRSIEYGNAHCRMGKDQ